MTDTGKTKRDGDLFCISQVSLFIAENADKDKKGNAAIFREFIQRFRTIIDNQNSRHNELSVAIKGYGYFAAVSTTIPVL